MMLEKVNLSDQFQQIHQHWQPKVVGDLNDQQVKLARLKGEFIWHAHDDEDEMFLVLNGQLLMQLRDQPDVVLNAGEFLVVPKGVEHRPVAEQEVQLLLFEPASTVKTGNQPEDSHA